MKFDHIIVDPKVCMGQPVIRGTRITVAVILRMTATGMSPAEIAHAYPELSKEDVLYAAAYGAWLASEQSRPFIQTLRYLADQNISPFTVALLKSNAFDICRVSDFVPASTDDTEILELARTFREIGQSEPKR